MCRRTRALCAPTGCTRGGRVVPRWAGGRCAVGACGGGWRCCAAACCAAVWRTGASSARPPGGHTPHNVGTVTCWPAAWIAPTLAVAMARACRNVPVAATAAVATGRTAARARQIRRQRRRYTFRRIGPARVAQGTAAPEALGAVGGLSLPAPPLIPRRHPTPPLAPPAGAFTPPAGASSPGGGCVRVAWAQSRHRNTPSGWRPT